MTFLWLIPAAIRPGNSKYEYIFNSPYFFLYVISMSLFQAFLSAVTSIERELVDGWSLSMIVSTVFFGLYIIEVLLRLFIKGFEFFLSLYNLAEVGLTLSAFILDLQLADTNFVANVLSLRIIWVIHKVPGMKFIVGGIVQAAPRLFVILFPLIIIVYVFAVIATSTLGPNSFAYPSPDYWLPSYNYTFNNGTVIQVQGADLPWDYYGDITKSMYTLFQVMTGDGWSEDVARPTMLYRPWSFLLFIVFYSLFAFVLLNIFTGIVVQAIQSYENTKSVDSSSKFPSEDTLVDDDSETVAHAKKDQSVNSNDGVYEFSQSIKQQVAGTRNQDSEIAAKSARIKQLRLELKKFNKFILDRLEQLEESG